MGCRADGNSWVKCQHIFKRTWTTAFALNLGLSFRSLFLAEHGFPLGNAGREIIATTILASGPRPAVRQCHMYLRSVHKLQVGMKVGVYEHLN